MTDVIRRRVVVTGRVQGVWFRDTCRRVAAEHGVAGWVRNRPDGTSVELVAEGPPAAVDALMAWAHGGPPRARVDRIEVTEEPPRGEVGFAVR